MHTTIIRGVLIGLALSVLVTANSAAVAETITYKAVLNAQNQPTPNDSKGTGTGEVTYDTTSKTLTWTINFDGLTGPATMAHFHGPAAAGAARVARAAKARSAVGSAHLLPRANRTFTCVGYHAGAVGSTAPLARGLPTAARMEMKELRP